MDYGEVVIGLNTSEVGMLHGVLGSDALSVVISQHLAEQVKGFP